MKSTVTEKPCKQEIKHPCLMYGESGLIVLMTSASLGTVIVANDRHKVGYTSNCWSLDGLFTGSVCLEND